MTEWAEILSKAFWLNLWKKGLSGWQQKGVNKFLLDNKDVILAGKQNARIFVPLCGKPDELQWFVDLGHHVVGVDYDEEFVCSYFDETGLQMVETRCPILDCRVLQTTDRRLQFFVCDILDFKSECTQPVDIVWDRSGFTSMKRENRARYAAVLKSLLAPDFSYALWSAVYDVSRPADALAPRSTEAVIKEHFGDVASKMVLLGSEVEHKARVLNGGLAVTLSLWHLSP